MKVKTNLDDFHYHEFVDRLHIVASMMDDHLIDHPVATNDKKIKKKLLKAQKKLLNLYQEVAAKTI